MNINESLGSMSPVNSFEKNPNKFTDVFGNAWQWCLDYFSPLNNFDVHPYYEGNL